MCLNATFQPPKGNTDILSCQFSGAINLWEDLTLKLIVREKTFLIRNLIFESHFKSYYKFLPMFAKKIAELSLFNECKQITVEKVSQGNIRENLESLLKNISN